MLSVDTRTNAMITAPGSFKTCHPINMVPISTQPHYNAAFFREGIFVAKQLFFRDALSAGQKQYAMQDDLAYMLDKSNCLYWGSSLMGLTYDFIADYLAQYSSSQSISYPCLRMVNCALAVSQDQKDGRAAVYLIDEMITGKFVKYINNNAAVPRNKLTVAEHNIALFLCFAQHIVDDENCC
ncbi:hypothetical protein SERLADRAFT_374257 [Serpula lacrymans var. lacrymans S7.9]|uniref:Alpha-type protein kinase domain-containing protein n=1 Tax=Serpula lacrymans var. lacrymans (strain S7.9) TaxID=578457 RepID=F8PB93_SERL9|nr:uncharacterized protein SERLADRAFT_374257 [Serpula lacrymans var. lacrymans S7.9]EGO19533.1 hypothetical protein SERLADRAFT_374257 [Serpula lacrymans var. lacrymans S7.9]